MGWPGKISGTIGKAKASVMRDLEISGLNLKRVAQAENGICKISEVQEIFQYRKISAFEKWILTTIYWEQKIFTPSFLLIFLKFQSPNLYCPKYIGENSFGKWVTLIIQILYLVRILVWLRDICTLVLKLVFFPNYKKFKFKKCRTVWSKIE